MDRLRRAKSIAAFRAVIRHRKVSQPMAGVPPEGPGSSFTAGHLISPSSTFKRSRHGATFPCPPEIAPLRRSRRRSKWLLLQMLDASI